MKVNGFIDLTVMQLVYL